MDLISAYVRAKVDGEQLAALMSHRLLRMLVRLKVLFRLHAKAADSNLQASRFFTSPDGFNGSTTASLIFRYRPCVLTGTVRRAARFC